MTISKLELLEGFCDYILVMGIITGLIVILTI